MGLLYGTHKGPIWATRIWATSTSTSTLYVDAVTLDSYATVVVLVKERKRTIVKLEEPGIDKR